MSDNSQAAEPGSAETPARGDGTRLRVITGVWAVLMAVVIVMIVLMLRG